MGVALAAARADGDPRRNPWIGAAFSAAALAGLAQQSILETGLLVGMIALAAAALLATGQAALTRAVATVPGAVLVAVSTGEGLASWATPMVLVLILVGGPLCADFDRSYASIGVLPALLAGTMAGVWATTPETEHVMVLAGAALPMALLGWPRARASLGTGGATLVLALVGWSVVADGQARLGSVIGGLACLGVLILEPAVRLASRETHEPTHEPAEPPLHGWRLAALVLLHGVVVVVCSRVAGLRTSAAAALAIAVVTYAVAAAALLFLRQKRPS